MQPTSKKETVPAIPGYYSYQPPGALPAIRLSLDALDGIVAEVMTGFGAIPRRGAEVGGILLGRQDADVIRIEGYAAVECQHQRGPSYLLSEQDREMFDATFEKERNAGRYPVGLYRSNTRDQFAATEEDRQLFAKYFPAPNGTFLLIRPYAGKTSTGMFLAYRNGTLAESNTDVFPFLRGELDGTPPPRRRALNEPRQRRSSSSSYEQPAVVLTPVVTVPEEAELPPVFSYGRKKARQSRGGSAWVGWLGVALGCMLLGALIGFQMAAIPTEPRIQAVDASAFALGLTATRKEENLHIQWNRQSPAIRLAQRGKLDIQDGKNRKSVELDAPSLQNGSVIYPPLSPAGTVRLEVTVQGASSVVQSLDWIR